MDCCCRRDFLTGIAALGVGALLPRALSAQTQRPRINVHHHLTSPSYVKFLLDNNVRDFPNRNLQQGLEDMDKSGVQTAFTSIIGPGLWVGNVEETRRLARESNEYAARAVRDYPGRFGMFASLTLPDIDGSLREIEYAFDTLKADGIYLFSSFGQQRLYGDKYLGDASLAPIYQELNRRKAFIYSHPKDAACCHNVNPDVPVHMVEYGSDNSRTIASLLLSGTAARYPDITWIFSHGGGTLPYLANRFLGRIAPYLEDGGKLRAGAPAERKTDAMPRGMLYELQKFYYDTASIENPLSLGALRKLVPLSHILFGTDWPFGTGVEHAEALHASQMFNEAELRAVERENAIKLLPRLRG